MVIFNSLVVEAKYYVQSTKNAIIKLMQRLSGESSCSICFLILCRFWIKTLGYPKRLTLRTFVLLATITLIYYNLCSNNAQISNLLIVIFIIFRFNGFPSGRLLFRVPWFVQVFQRSSLLSTGLFQGIALSIYISK